MDQPHTSQLPIHKLARTSSINKQMQLLDAFQNRRIQQFREVLNNNLGLINVNYLYKEPMIKTLLEFAISENALNYVDILLKAGADVNFINPVYKQAAIHFCVEAPPKIAILKRLLNEKDIDINILGKANKTALMSIVRNAKQENMKAYKECAQLLLENGIDCNIPDAKGLSPIYVAAKHGYQDIVSTVLRFSKTKVDIDSFPQSTSSEKSARDLIIEKKLITETELPSFTARSVSIVFTLFNLLNQHNEEKFLEELDDCYNKTGNLTINDKAIVDQDNGLNSLLQLSSKLGLEKCVRHLLKYDADINLTNNNCNSLRPIEIVCDRGYFNILAMFLEHPKIHVPPTILHTVVKNFSLKHVDNKRCNFATCLDLLLRDARINVNAIDAKRNSALHLAARTQNHEAVLALLRAGASVTIRNSFDVLPLADIAPNTLSSYLDECVTTNNERITDVNYQILFNYRFLVPLTNLHPEEVHIMLNGNDYTVEMELSNRNIDDDTQQNNNDNNLNFRRSRGSYALVPSGSQKKLSAETDILLYMSQNSELRPLLKHPILTSFLFLKWQKISWLFYINLLFYIIFCMLLVTYIIFGYGQEKSFVTLQAALGVVVGLLSLREIFQLIATPKRYIKNFENWLEIPLIIITYHIVLREPAEHVRQQLSATAILLAAVELILLIGQHPKLSTNIVMLRTVSWNFFKFLLWYSILIIAFALTFFTLFRETTTRDQSNTTSIENDDENVFFKDPGMSLFKTIVMLTGEFEASDINFKSFPVTSHIIFVLFVFLIAIVLFNLLNALAVSDTQIIKQDAQLLGYISRIQIISHFEHMILGQNTSPSKLSKVLSIKSLAEKICLFPKDLPKYMVWVKPNQNGIVIKNEEESKFEEAEVKTCCLCGTGWCDDLMESSVIKEAKCCISKKITASYTYDESKIMLSTIEKRLQDMETLLKSMIDAK